MCKGATRPNSDRACGLQSVGKSGRAEERTHRTHQFGGTRARARASITRYFDRPAARLICCVHICIGTRPVKLPISTRYVARLGGRVTGCHSTIRALR